MNRLSPQTPDGSRMLLGLALHNHQPVGNFPSVFAMAYDKAYLPMIEALERHPTIRLSMHYSGPLLDWLTQNRPAFLDRVSALSALGQVEIVGGGYYEPILPNIPDADRIGQIRKMAGFCQKRFGQTPSGLWLAERVWEPDLPRSLAQAGVEWTLVDDTHFKMTGLADEDLFGYYLTEDQGNAVKVYGTSKYLRYAVPFQPVEKVIEYLHRYASEKRHAIAVMGDDGEKFGVWPHTYEHCWGPNGWVERFLSAIEESRSWLLTIPLGEYARQNPPLGRVYLPAASYDEMLEWALPPARSRELIDARRRMESEGKQDVLPYLRGGYWRNFMVKYPEINWMHKKMLWVHRKVYRACELSGTKPGLDDLWQAQCNCPYWHGVFGGFYLSDIRATTYQHLIKAEVQADSVLRRAADSPSWENTDFDLDGYDELLVEGKMFGLCFSPRSGGSLIEWDLHNPPFNILCTASRRPEAYHRDIARAASGSEGGTQTIHAGLQVKDPRAAQLLKYDKYPRVSMIDHFLGPEITPERFAASEYDEQGSFAGQPYEASAERRGAGLLVSAARTAELYVNGTAAPFKVSRTVDVRDGDSRLELLYRLTNLSATTVSSTFAVEWNMNLLGGGHNDQAYYEVPGIKLDDWHLDSAGSLPGISQIVLGNRHLGIRMRLDIRPAADVWRFPVETATNSDAGVEGLYQASCILIRMPFTLLPDQGLEMKLIWTQEHQK